MGVEQEHLLKLTEKRRKHLQSCHENEDESHKLVTNLYSDKFHFIYELLQNADDAQASEISFTLRPEALEIRHNGKLFDYNDVYSITTIGSSTKAEDINLIGKFGAGFKSVFAVTNTPYIHSGAYHFKIVDLIVPEQVEPLDIEGQYTTIKLPFNHDKMSSDDAYAGISRILEKELKSESLLFLRNIKKISWQTTSNTGDYSVEIDRTRAKLIAQIDQQEHVTDYLMFEKDIEIDSKSLKIVIAYQIFKGAITPTADDKLFVFFPTKETIGLKFLIHAPYKTTPNRETIDFIDEQNQTITEELSTLIAESIQATKEAGFLSVDFLNLLPIDSSTKNPLYASAFAKVKLALTTNELLPTADGGYVNAEKALLASRKNLTDLLKREDCAALFEKEAWLSTEITDDRTRELRSYLTKTLDIPEVNMEKFCKKITDDFMASKADEWVIEFYSELTNHRALYSPYKGILYNRPILRLENGSHINPRENDKDEGLQVYLPFEEMESEFKTVKKIFFENKKSLEFLKGLGLIIPDQIAEIKEFIVPKYEGSDIDIAIAEYQKDFEKARGIWQDSDESDSKKIIELLEKLHFVRCINQHKTSSYQKPADVYFRKKDLLAWYEGNHKDNIYFLEEGIYSLEAEPSNKASNKEFLRSLGVRDKVKIYGAGYFTKSKLDNDNHRYEEGVKGFNPEFDIDGLEYAIEHITLKKSVFLWSILLGHTNRLKGCIQARQFKSHSFKNDKEQSSRAMETLSGKQWLWLYNKAGELIVSQIAEIKLDALHDDYKTTDENSEKLAKVLGMELDEVAKLLKLCLRQENLLKEKREELKAKDEKIKSQNKQLEYYQEKERRENESDATSTAEPLWKPSVSPEDDNITEVEFPLRQHESKDLSNQIPSGNTGENIHSFTTEKGESSSPAPNTANKKRIGERGERAALKHLKKKYSPKEVIWLNDRGCVGKGYDIVMKEKGEEIAYFEVKSTVESSRTQFQMTRTQWGWARDLYHKGKGDMYVILVVFNTGKKNTKILPIKNPFERWKLGELQANPVNIMIVRPLHN